jgi:methionyl-tRNA formyltransferase
MQMDAGLDTGDMLAIKSLAIAPTDTTGSLHDKLAALGARMMVDVLASAGANQLTPVPQPAEGITYAAKIDKAEALIDWNMSATTIARCVRAFNPFPGAHTTVAGDLLKIWEAQHINFDSNKINADMPKGHVLSQNSDGIDVLTGEGVLRITQLQRAGAKRMAAVDFGRGQTALTGTVLGSA